MSSGFRTRTGEEAIQAEDGGEAWFRPTQNPFGHGCCDCGLFHQVEYALADEQGNEIPLPAGAGIVLRFRRDAEETERLRAHKNVDLRMC